MQSCLAGILGIEKELVNAERYITQELKEYEEKILGAEDKILVLETKLYNELVVALAELDVYKRQFLFLFVYMVEHIVTFGCEIHFHVCLIADGLQTFRISTHFLHRVTA